jgi:hypothetical protein
MITGRGIAQSGGWPPDESIIVLGYNESTAITLVINTNRIRLFSEKMQYQVL